MISDPRSIWMTAAREDSSTIQDRYCRSNSPTRTLTPTNSFLHSFTIPSRQQLQDFNNKTSTMSDNHDNDFIKQLPKDNVPRECKLFILNGELHLGLLDNDGNVIAHQTLWNPMVENVTPLLTASLTPQINTVVKHAIDAGLSPIIAASNAARAAGSSSPARAPAPAPSSDLFKTLKFSSPQGKSLPVEVDISGTNTNSSSSVSSNDEIDHKHKNEYYAKWLAHKKGKEGIYGQYNKTDTLAAEFRSWFESTCSVSRFGNDKDVRKATLYAICETFIQDNKLPADDADRFRTTLQGLINDKVGANTAYKRKSQSP